MLERRDILGGACVTEEVWPGQRVSRASYVVSMLQPKVVEDLRLRDFGYEPIPLDPAFGTITPDGLPVFFFNDAERTRTSVARLSKRDALRYPEFEEMLARLAGFLRPLMLRPPPALGSKRPGDLLALLREAGRTAGLARRDVLELFRVMTMSVGDLLDEWFESDVLKGAWASTGVVGVWAGPRTPGTAYNLLHHALGELEGVSGLWGHVRGRHGRHLAWRSRAAPRPPGPRSGPARRSSSIDVESGRVTGVTLESGEQIRAPLVVSGAHPRTTILELAGAAPLPGGGRARHGALPLARRLRQGQLHPLRAAPLRGRLGRGGGAPAEHRDRALPVHRLPGACLAGRHTRRAGRGPLR